MVPLLTRSISTRSNSVETLKAFDWPGVGARKPVLSAAAQLEVLVDLVAAGELAVGGGAEVLEVLEADRDADRPLAVAAGALEVAVDRVVAAAPAARGDRTEAGEAVRCGAEALLRQRADLVGLELPDADGELLVAPLEPAGEVGPVVDRVAEIEVEVGLLLLVETRVEGGRRLRAERRVDRVGDEEVDLVGAGRDARVPGDAARGRSADAGEDRRVRQVAAEVGGEPAGEDLLEREAVRIGEDRGQRCRIQDQLFWSPPVRTVGQPAEPSSTPSCASSRSPISSVSEP